MWQEDPRTRRLHSRMEVSVDVESTRSVGCYRPGPCWSWTPGDPSSPQLLLRAETLKQYPVNIAQLWIASVIVASPFHPSIPYVIGEHVGTA